MQSDGGLTIGEKYSGLKAILSGPAGGVVAIASTCYNSTEGTPVIGIDMVRVQPIIHKNAKQLKPQNENHSTQASD